MQARCSKNSGLRSSVKLTLVAVATFAFCLPPLAAADIIQDLTVFLDFNCLTYNLPCSADAGHAGSPATGSADFTSRPDTPWSYQFVTGPATSWTQHQFFYEAQFDCTASPCGSFTVTGPYGLTFTGAITQGSSSFSTENTVMVDFTGWWSNGVYGYGNADVTQGIHNAADLRMFAQAPEPSSLLLLGSSALGLAGLLRRRLLN